MLVVSLIHLLIIVHNLAKSYNSYHDSQNIQYDQVDVTSPAETDTETCDEEVMYGEDPCESKEVEYQSILASSKKSVIHFFVAGAVYVFFKSTRNLLQEM